MGRWKVRVEFLLSVIELLFLCLTVEALRSKMCQKLLPSGGGKGVRHLEPRFQGEGVRSSVGNIFGFYKTRHILLSDSTNCTVLCAVVLTQYRRVTDRQTDGIAIASIALIAERCKNLRRRYRLCAKHLNSGSFIGIGDGKIGDRSIPHL